MLEVDAADILNSIEPDITYQKDGEKMKFVDNEWKKDKNDVIYLCST